MTATQTETLTIELRTRAGNFAGHAVLTPFDVAADPARRYSVTLDADAAENFAVPAGELLGWMRRDGSRWFPIGCHNLADALTSECREIGTYMPLVSSRAEAVRSLALLRWAENAPDAPSEPLRAAQWAGVHVPRKWFKWL